MYCNLPRKKKNSHWNIVCIVYCVLERCSCPHDPALTETDQPWVEVSRELTGPTHQTQHTADVSRQELRITMLLPTLSLSGGGETCTNHLNNNLKYLLNLQGRSASLSSAVISPSYQLMINLNLLSQFDGLLYCQLIGIFHFIEQIGNDRDGRIKYMMFKTVWGLILW